MPKRKFLPLLLVVVTPPAILWCAAPARNAHLWYLKPVERPQVPAGLTHQATQSTHSLLQN